MVTTIGRIGERARQSAARATTDANRLAEVIKRTWKRRDRETLRRLEEMGYQEWSEGEWDGALLALAREAGDGGARLKWEETSRKAAAAAEEAAAVPPVKLYIDFGGPVPKDVYRELRAAGLEWRKLHGYYEGEIRLAEAEALAAKHGGRVGLFGGTVVPLAMSAE
jgi:hypothetical protein